jgi:hypothetical protein
MNALLLPVEYCTRVSERPLADGGRAALHRVRGRQRLEVPLRHAADRAIVARDRAVLSLDVADPPVKVGRVAPSVRPAESTAFLPSKNKTVFLRCHLYDNVKTNILPRQARDKPRENTQKGLSFSSNSPCLDLVNCIDIATLLPGVGSPGAIGARRGRRARMVMRGGAVRAAIPVRNAICLSALPMFVPRLSWRTVNLY